jgi:hypothetical protein
LLSSTSIELWRTGRELYGQMTPKSIGLGQMSKSMYGKRREKDSILIGRNLGKLMWVCNTIPSLKIDFQAINVWVIELGMLTEHFMKQIQCCFSIS